MSSNVEIKPEEFSLLCDTIKICIENRIGVNLLPKKNIKKLYFGSFNTNPLKLNFAISNTSNYSLYWSAFTHETCHIDQYLEKSKIFLKYMLDDISVDDFPNCYFNGKYKNVKKSKKYFDNILRMELECEQKTLKKIKKYRLNINPSIHIQQANLYMYYHIFMWKYKKELFGLEYENYEILNKMPKKLLTPKEYWDTFDSLNLKWI